MRRLTARLVAVLFVLSLAAPHARADERRAARGMMIAGIVLTGAGIVLAAPGIALVASAASCQGPSCDNHGSGLVGELGGAAMIALGGSLIVTGVPLWIVGQRRFQRARVSLAPTSLALRF